MDMSQSLRAALTVENVSTSGGRVSKCLNIPLKSLNVSVIFLNRSSNLHISIGCAGISTTVRGNSTV